MSDARAAAVAAQLATLDTDADLQACYPAGSLQRSVRITCIRGQIPGRRDAGGRTTQGNWDHFCKLFLGLRVSFEERMDAALQTLGLPEEGPPVDGGGRLPESQRNIVLSALHQMQLVRQSAFEEMAWSSMVGPVAIFAGVRSRVIDWINANVDRLVPAAPIVLGVGGGGDGGGGNAGIAAAEAATAALEAISASADVKQIIQVAADGSWPEADILAATMDESFGLLLQAITERKPDSFQTAVLAKPYADQTAGCLLLLKAIITRKPTLAIAAVNKQAFKNSTERKRLAAAIIAFTQIQSKPAADDFNSSCAGIRPPAISDLGAAWDLASQLHSDAWGGGRCTSSPLRSRSGQGQWTHCTPGTWPTSPAWRGC